MRPAARSALFCVATAVAALTVAPAATAADTRPPTIPTNLHVGQVTPTTVQLLFDPSRDDVRVAGYVVTGGPRQEIASDGYAFMQLLQPATSTRSACWRSTPPGTGPRRALP